MRNELGSPSSSAVLGVRDRLQVFGIHAATDPAEVIKLGSFWDGAVKLLIVDTVRKRHPCRRPYLPIAVAILREPPQPTRRVVARIGLDVPNSLACSVASDPAQ